MTTKEVMDVLNKGKIVTLSSDKPILEIQPPVKGLVRTSVRWMQEKDLSKNVDFIPIDKLETTISTLMGFYPDLHMMARTKK